MHCRLSASHCVLRIDQAVVTGVASYEALGHMPPSISNCWIFWGHFRAAQTLTFDFMWLPCLSSKTVYSFVTVYCMNFIIFLCVTLKLFSLSFVPLLTPNPGDATGSRLYYVGFIGRNASLVQLAICLDRCPFYFGFCSVLFCVCFRTEAVSKCSQSKLLRTYDIIIKCRFSINV